MREAEYCGNDYPAGVESAFVSGLHNLGLNAIYWYIHLASTFQYWGYFLSLSRLLIPSNEVLDLD
jgi:hypothetical protein